MVKTIFAFVGCRNSENALAVVKLLLGFLSPVHRAELMFILAELHDAAELAVKVSETVEETAK